MAMLATPTTHVSDLTTAQLHDVVGALLVGLCVVLTLTFLHVVWGSRR